MIDKRPFINYDFKFIINCQNTSGNMEKAGWYYKRTWIVISTTSFPLIIEKGILYFPHYKAYLIISSNSLF